MTLVAPPPVPSAAIEAGRRARAVPLPAVDSCTVLSATEVTAHKLIRADDPYMEGHYPDFTIYPGVFVIESVYQAVLHLVWENHGTHVFAEPARITSVRFLAALRPGDRLDIHCVAKAVGADGTQELEVTADCRRGDVRAAKVSMSFRLTSGTDTGAVSDGNGAGAGAGSGGPETALLEHAEIRGTIPHAHPMLLVDRVLDLDPYDRIVTSKAITGSESCYARLAPDAGARALRYPPSLLIESWGQGGALLWLRRERAKGQPGGTAPILAAVRGITFHRGVHPGDTLRHTVRIDQYTAAGVIMSGQTHRGDELVAEIGEALAVLRPSGELF
ncbi:3-hydroxyacyl-ACP dehydratase FabZ family protein [Streptomyces broussonetiae]|uniref:3-hydroxyacyl-ACP dehydratase FabZ family protein n=1 Tax=Streptomyces broussonetiae TaxID=2686304 RepID=UPI0035DD2B01